MYWDAKMISKLPLYNTFIEKLEMEKLSNSKLLQELHLTIKSSKNSKCI